MSVTNCPRCGAGVFTGPRLTELPRVGIDTVQAIREAAWRYRSRFGSPLDAQIADDLTIIANTLVRAARESQD